MKPRNCACRFASSMFPESGSSVTFGCVSVCTKSLFVVIDGGGCGTVAGTGGTVIDAAVSGCTFTGVCVVLCRQAGTAMRAIRTSPLRNPFTALVIAFQLLIDDITP